MNIVTLLALEVADGDNGSFGHMDGWGGGWMWLWGTLMMLTWVVVIAAASWIVLRPRDRGATPRPTPRDIVDERLARGELTVEEHRERIDQLCRTDGPNTMETSHD